MNGAINIVNSLETALSTMKDSANTSRATADDLLKNMLQDNSMALGVWTGWEPNAFDGKDKDFVGKEGHDATGRYVPYWVRSGDKIQHTPLTDYTVSGAGDYYQLPLHHTEDRRHRALCLCRRWQGRADDIGRQADHDRWQGAWRRRHGYLAGCRQQGDGGSPPDGDRLPQPGHRRRQYHQPS
jgi:hypothetical protein